MSKIPRDKIATWFVTGASSGVGHELCKQLLERDYNIVAVARRIPAFKHDNALCLSCDVTDPKSVASAVALGVKKFGRIDVLSNNAGITSSLFIEDETLEHLQMVMQVNYFGTFNTMKALIPHFRANGHGTIINNTSQSGLSPRIGGCAYCSSKYAIEGLTGVAKIETQHFCRVITLELGYFRGTEVSKTAGQTDNQYRNKTDELKRNLEVYKNLTPLHKPYTMKNFYNDLAPGIKYLIDEIENRSPQRRLILGKDAVIKVTGEIESLQHDLNASMNRALAVSKNIKYKRHRILRLIIKSLVDKKRYKKLKEDPGSFFADSQSTIIKFIGKFYD